jgi:hypothetical protein
LGQGFYGKIIPTIIECDQQMLDAPDHLRDHHVAAENSQAVYFKKKKKTWQIP